MRVTEWLFLGGWGLLFVCGCTKAPLKTSAHPTPTATTTAVVTTAPTDGNHIVAADLALPVRLKAGGDFIDTEVGHAAPFIADIDRDGLRDLLVGQFGEGKLKVCRNVGTNEQPEYESPTFFQAGGDVAQRPRRVMHRLLSTGGGPQRGWL